MAHVPKSLRTKADRRKLASSYRPPSSLPDVAETAKGQPLRWIRTSLLGDADPQNVFRSRADGWEPIPASQVPEAQKALGLKGDQNVEIGGLVLCRNSQEKIDARNAYYEERGENELRAVDEQLTALNDRRMPLLRERSSKTTTHNR